MRIAFFDTHRFEKPYFEKANQTFRHEILFLDVRLTAATVRLASGFPAVCGFVNDQFDQAMLKILYENGTKIIALRSAGFNNVDLIASERLGLVVVRVPEYSPYAVAEHTVALILSLNRKIHRAYNRVREGNFNLDGLTGFDLHGKTVGIIGTGRIGAIVAKIMTGFGCRVLAYDLLPNTALSKEIGVQYADLDQLLKSSDIITLHVPLTPLTRHMIGPEAFSKMRTGAFLINTGRGALIETAALIKELKAGRLGAAGLDVYEEEEGIFFHDLSGEILQDDLLARLLTFPNVLLTSHQAFLTKEALLNIAETTLKNLKDYENGRALENQVKVT